MTDAPAILQLIASADRSDTAMLAAIDQKTLDLVRAYDPSAFAYFQIAPAFTRSQDARHAIVPEGYAAYAEPDMHGGFAGYCFTTSDPLAWNFQSYLSRGATEDLAALHAIIQAIASVQGVAA